MGSIEDNKRIAERFLDLVSEHRIDELCAMVTPSWTMLGGPPQLPSGPEGIRTLFGTFGRIEQTWEIEQVVAEGDTVVVRAVNSCTMDTFFGVDGRGKRQVFGAMFMHRIVDGKIAFTWRNADDLGRLMQLGARIVPGAS